MPDIFNISEIERKKVIENFVDNQGKVKRFPRKEKKKVILLQEVIKKFSANQYYNEKEINEKIREMFEDHATVRRYLIDYQFLAREKNGEKYWVTNLK